MYVRINITYYRLRVMDINNIYSEHYVEFSTIRHWLFTLAACRVLSTELGAHCPAPSARRIHTHTYSSAFLLPPFTLCYRATPRDCRQRRQCPQTMKRASRCLVARLCLYTHMCVQKSLFNLH